jgi:hypothetical protein
MNRHVRDVYDRAMRWQGIVVVVVACLGACSGGKPALVAHEQQQQQPRSDAAAPKPAMTTCPKTSKEAVGACEINDVTIACDLGDTICGCRGYCGGAEPRVMPSSQWRCQPKPPKIRPDACPGELVKAGTKCSKAGLECTYVDCCAATYKCSGGKWELGEDSCPP